MEICSEKIFYDNVFKELYRKCEQDIFLWGEDLIDKHLYIYPKKLKNVPSYSTFADRLVNCGLIVINLNKNKILTCIATRYDELTGNLYITESNFNALWSLLKKSIELGIHLAKKNGIECRINVPEDILSLDCLQRTTSNPVLKNDRIIYKPTEAAPEETRLIAARQSAIDNQKNLFFYAKSAGYVHDRQCKQVKNIKLDEFVGSATFPEGREYCPHCSRQIFIRMGCSHITKEIPICNLIFTKYGIKTNQIYRFVTKEGMHFHAKSLSEMTINCKEDTWVIKIDNNKLELWHNNYIRTSPTERYITQGFHKQRLSGNSSMYQLLNYITNYSWQKHLAAENTKVETKDTKPVEISAPVAVPENPVKKLSLWQRFVSGIKKLFH